MKKKNPLAACGDQKIHKPTSHQGVFPAPVWAAPRGPICPQCSQVQMKL